MSNIISSPVTTTFGLTAILQSGSAILADLASGVSWKQELFSAHVGTLIAGIIGLFAKDWDVTGGSVAQDTVANPPVLPTK